MPPGKGLPFSGVLLVALSFGIGVVYRQAIVGSPGGLIALLLLTVAGTILATAGRFYTRLKQSSESNQSSENLLRDSEARFRHLFDISPFPAVLTAIGDSRVLAVNQRTVDRFGIPNSKAVGLHAPDFYVDPSQRAAIMEQVGRTGQAEGFLVQLRTPKGEEVWADVHARLVKFEGEAATLAIFHDVTERVAAEQALRASEQRLAAENSALTELTARQARGAANFEDRLRDIVEMAAKTLDVERVSMWSLESEQSAIRCVDLYEREAAQHSSGQVMYRSEFSTYFEAIESERLIAAKNALTDRRTAQFVEPYLKPLGIGAMLDVPLRQNDITIGVLCLEHVGGERSWTADEQNFALSLANFIVVALSDAGFKEAVENLAQSEARARLIVDTAHDAFVGMNSDGKIVMWNAQAVATFGWTLRRPSDSRLLIS